MVRGICPSSYTLWRRGLVLAWLGAVPLACSEADFQGSSGRNDKEGAEANPSDPSGSDDKKSGLKASSAGDFGIDPRDFTDSVHESGWVNEGKITDLRDFDGPPEYGDFNRDDGATYWIACNPDEWASNASTEVSGPKGSKMRVTGHFCPKGEIEQNLTVLFVIDFSGSMDGSNVEGPNDPLSGGSCGRLQASIAVIDEILSKAGDSGASVTAGMVGFSVQASLRIPIADAATVKASLNTGNMCGSDDPNATTNYEAAFNVARQTLAGVEGPKVIYFISDGSPTAGGGFFGDPASAGLAAAKSLRQAIDDLTLNVVFLGYRNGDANNPQRYLEQIAGDARNVKLVANANDLVKEIKDLEIPEVGIRKSSVKAVLSGGGKQDEVIKIDFVRKGKNGRYIFGTEPFELRGKKGAVTSNTVNVGAVTTTDEDLEASVRIKFRQTN